MPVEKQNKHQTLATIALIAILSLAAFLRLHNLKATEFKYDEATVCNLAARFVDTGIPPVRGMGSSVGIDNPPMMVYLMSLPVLLSRDPLIASGYVALINVAAIWGCFALTKRYWSTGVGLLVALLLATSPWAIFYSRKVWAQNVLLPGVLAFFWFVLRWLDEDRPWSLTGAIIALVLLTQIHFAMMAFIPLLGLLGIIRLIADLRQKQQITWWLPLLVGAGIGLVLYSPYFAADALTDWKNIRAFMAMMKQPSQFSWLPIRYALLNIGGREIHALAGAEKYQLWLSSLPALDYWPDRIEETAAVLGFVYLGFRWWRNRRTRQTFVRDGILLIWVILPILFYLRSQNEVFPHYMIPLYPVQHLLVGIMAVDGYTWLRNRLEQQSRYTLVAVSSIAAAALLGLVVWQSMLSISIHAFVDQHETPGGLGTPIRIHRQVSKTIDQYRQQWDNDQVVVLCPGNEPRWDQCPAVFNFISGRQVDLRLADYEQSLVFPKTDRDTLIVLVPGESKAMQTLPTFAEELTSAVISLRENTGQYRFYRLPGGSTPQPSVQPTDAPISLANGISILGYDLNGDLAPGTQAQLTLYWRIDHIPDNPPPQGYSLTTNILDAEGNRYGQRDGPGHPASHWRQGDILVSWFDLSLAQEMRPKPYSLQIGAYVFTPPSEFETIRVVDAAGQPVAGAVDWLLETK